MESLEYFNKGDLHSAVQAAESQVRAAPGSGTARYVLAELLLFQGDYDRADSQFDALASIDPKAALAVAQVRRLLRAEMVRQQYYEAGRVPKFLLEPTAEQRLRMRGLAEYRHDPKRAAALYGEAEAAHVMRAGAVDGFAFEALVDGDDRLGGGLEILGGDGEYYLVGFEQIGQLTFQPPKRPLDLLYRSCRLCGPGLPDAEVFVPVLYPGSSCSERTEIQLGRATDWENNEGCHHGIGQRVLFADEREIGLLEISEICWGDAS